MTESYTPREFIDKINAENPGPAFDPYGVEGLRLHNSNTTEQDILAQAKAKVAEEKAKNTPEAQQIAELERQVEDMKQWLLKDGTYTPSQVDYIIQYLSVEYDEDKQEAVVRGDLNLSGLKSADNLKLPTSVGGNLWLSSLTSADNLKLPTSIGGNFWLNSLTSAKDLTLPTSIGGSFWLDSLTSAKDLTLPTSIGGGFWLSSLTSVKDLTLPTSVDGGLYLNRLTSDERDEIRAQRPDLASKILPTD